MRIHLISARRFDGGQSFLPIVLILLLGAALRLPLLTRDSRFQVDEALYATFARHVTQTGDLLLSGMALDKPPLLFWAMSGSFALFGVSEFAARLPDVAASLVTVAIVYALTRRLYGDTFGARANRRVALIAALLLAVSPYDRGFAATAFTDPLLTAFILAGCWAAVSGRWRIGGLLLAGAFAVKPSALQWLPLALALGATQMDKWQDALRGALKLASGFAAGVMPLAIWSAARATWPDFWTLNWYNNNPGRLIRANELTPRLAQWGHWLQTIVPLPVIGWLAGPLYWRIDRRPSRVVVIDLILTAYTLGSLAELWLVAFNVYDRYLHTLTPLLLILLARVIGRAPPP
ncbi:MAG: ArnT family glycosyltransferase, partial [Aggregatilineales bacterium]